MNKNDLLHCPERPDHLEEPELHSNEERQEWVLYQLNDLLRKRAHRHHWHVSSLDIHTWEVAAIQVIHRQIGLLSYPISPLILQLLDRINLFK